jgi:hypothetical protein
MSLTQDDRNAALALATSRAWRDSDHYRAIANHRADEVLRWRLRAGRAEGWYIILAVALVVVSVLAIAG